MPVKITEIAAVLPEQIVSSAEVVRRISQHSPGLKIPANLVQTVTGIETRRYIRENVNASDLAAAAACRVMAKAGIDPAEIDLLVFASASQDLIEPATAHIVQAKIGTSAAVMDIKNACNSFLNGLQIAEALMLSGQYRRALVVTGETPSYCVKWAVADRQDLRLSFPGYTLGDAGAAAVLDIAETGQGIFYRNFHAVSEHWSAGTLACGGSLHPRGDEHTYFQGDGLALKDAFMEVGPQFLQKALQATGTTLDDYARILVHQVTMPFLELFLKTTGIPPEKVVVTLPSYGNMAAASLPVGFDLAANNGEIRRGDKVMFIGLAGGISLGIIAFEY